MAVVPDLVLELVERFKRNEANYRSAKYNETQVRRDFIDPLFGALGWDVANRAGVPENLRGVVHEDSLQIDGVARAPDYSFRVGGNRRFFVEAKKPSINLAESAKSALQVRRYAWSAKLPISVLTDFEEFAIYDCRVPPNAGDSAKVARVRYWKFTEYAEVWEELSDLLDQPSVAGGSLEAYERSASAPRGHMLVDDAFLAELDRWRAELAMALASNNPSLEQGTLNFSVQRIIDRLVFLRMCEDRGIEEYGQLRAAAEGQDPYSGLRGVFLRADEKYNSGLFHFKRERGRPQHVDDVTPSLVVPAATLRSIVDSLYFPKSPYAFSVLSPDILGRAYERFLGKSITLDMEHCAIIEEKPLVKKAGGVFYTPEFIVDRMVHEVLAPLLADKSPRSAASLRIVDPACGSGTFLLGVYRYLLRWYTTSYAGSADAVRRGLAYESSPGNWRLTTREKKRILVDHVFGVDVDTQAVEVTKLSLLLQVLEGESSDVLERQLSLLQERALPDLGNNIVSGNSLIDLDFYTGQLQLEPVVENRVNPMNWESTFPSVFGRSRPGFDAVIGNPPYVRIQAYRTFAPEEAQYIAASYRAASTGMFDVYMPFVEQGLRILRNKGQLGFILPNKFMATDAATGLRGMLSTGRNVKRIVDFGHHQVFPQATTYTCLLFLEKRKRTEVEYVSVPPHQTGAAYDTLRFTRVPAAELGETQWGFPTRQERALLTKLGSNTVSLLAFPADMARGSSTGADDVFTLRHDGGRLLGPDGAELDIESELLRVPIASGDFTALRSHQDQSRRTIVPYLVSEGGYELLPEDVLRADYPKTFEYLNANRERLEERKGYKQWFGFSAPRSLHIHDDADILVPLLADRPSYGPACTGAPKSLMMAGAGFSVRLRGASELDRWAVAGILNSDLLWWHLRFLTRNNRFRGDWCTCTKQYFGKLRLPDESTRGRLAHAYAAVAELAQTIAGLFVDAPEARTRPDKRRAARKREAAWDQLNRQVAVLYGLDDEGTQLVTAESCVPART